MGNKLPLHKALGVLCFLGLLLLSPSLFAQGIVAKGKVVDAKTNESLVGVFVLQKGTTNGQSTDIDGSFSLNVPKGSTLVVSFVGFNDLEIQANEDLATIQLQTSLTALDEVVVVGYGVQKKSLVTGAISSVSAKDLERPGMMRADEALQGKVAGVTVMSNSGQPGEGISIRIRGTGTNGHASPLYIVDGQSIEDISFLNPRDIQSMEVLKDAASSAIYGARGANGVVMISTKKGKFGERMAINYDFSFGIQNIRKKMDLLNASQYAMIQNEAAFNSNQNLPFNADALENIRLNIGKGTDWQEEILLNNAPVINHQLSLVGGSEHTAYNVSASYLNHDGIIAKDKSNYERLTLREGTDHSYFGKFLKIGQSLVISRVTKKGIDPNNTFGGPILGAINMDPLTPVYNQNGSYAESEYVSQEIANPVARISLVNSKNKFTKLLANVYAEMYFLNGFKWRSTLSSEMNFDDNWSYSPAYRLNSANVNFIPGTQKETSSFTTTIYENTLSYDRTINKHVFSAMLGNSVSKSNGDNLGGNKKGLLIDLPEYAYLDLAKDEESAKAWGGAWHHALVSYFGRVNYNFDNRYMFTATMRADGSTRFGKNNRFGYFPSVSGGWNISNESFLKDVKAINSLKLRASWGQNGNERIGDWQYLATISTGARGYIFGDKIYPGASPDKVPNPDLKWETSEQTNIGVDLRFLEKFSLSADYYVKNTKDLLIVAPIPSYVGAPAPFSNAGNVRNSGIELALGYRDAINDFSWNVDFNIAYNKNEVIKVGNSEGWIGGSAVGTAMQNVTRMEEGFPISYFWGFQTLGLFQNLDEVNAHVKNGELIQPAAQAGDIRYADLNNDGKIDDKDRTKIGNPNPDFTAGLSIGASWKNFDVSAFFNGMFGHDVFNATRRWDLPMSNYQTTVLDRWYAEGSSNKYPRVTTTDPNNNFSRPSDFFLESATFVRLKNISLGYTTTSLEKYYINKLRVYVAASNLLTFTNYTGLDPEIGDNKVFNSGIDYGMYPQARTFTFGVSVTF